MPSPESPPGPGPLPSPAGKEGVPATMQPIEAREPQGGPKARVFLAAFVVFQVLLLAATFPIACTRWYLWHDAYAGLRNFGYAERVGPARCEVLLYGDSSALTALDPAIIEHRTGLKACNIAEGTTEQRVVGSDRPLQAYLRHNPPPRFLLGTWTPSMLRPDIAPYSEFQPEGVEYALQYGDRRDMFRHLLRKPVWAVKFAVYTLDRLAFGLEDALSGDIYHQIDARAQRDARNGQWPYPRPVQTACVGFLPGTVERWDASVAAFRRKYESPQTTVIIDVSPAAVCDPSFSIYQRQDAGLYDNTLEQLPVSYFNEGDLHFSAQGSRYISEGAARQILARMGRQAGQAENTGR